MLFIRHTRVVKDPMVGKEHYGKANNNAITSICNSSNSIKIVKM